MKLGRHLVIEHLEDISWRVLKEYPEIVREMIRGKSGIYALYRRNQLYYVGLASNLRNRINQHLKDRHADKWDRFSVYLTCEDGHMKEIESLLLRIVKPVGNQVGGKLVRSVSLRRRLNQDMKERDADRRAKLIGGRVARQRTRSKIARPTPGQPALAGVVDRAVALRAWRAGYQYRASLRKTGQIYYEGELYDSPSAAGKIATGKACNGWAFWHYRDSKSRQWVPIGRLRR